MPGPASTPAGRALPAVLAATLLVALGAAAAAAESRTSSDTVTVDGLQWALSTNGEDVPWADAEQYCSSLSLDGHDDWRLPSMTELESLHDPSVSDGYAYRQPFALDTCCLWSGTTLEQLPPETGGDTAGDHSRYAWGFLFDGGIRYFSFMDFPDGQALCTREAQ